MLVVRVVGRSTDYAVDGTDVRRVPRRIYWRHETGRAIGPDGSALGLWAVEEFGAREMRDGRVIGPSERFAIEDVVAIKASMRVAARAGREAAGAGGTRSLT